MFYIVLFLIKNKTQMNFLIKNKTQMNFLINKKRIILIYYADSDFSCRNILLTNDFSVI